MTTTENNTEDKLWNVSVTPNRSWVDIMEEEERELEAMKKIANTPRLNDKKSSALTCNGVEVKTEIKIEPEEEAQEVGLSSTLPIKIPSVDGLPNFGKVLSSDSLQKTPIKEEPTQIFTEDISLTGHLDGFKLISPCKVDSKSNAVYNKASSHLFKTPEKVVPKCLSSPCGKGSDVKKETCKRKLTGVKADDDALMPSPSKISRVTSAEATVSTPPTSAATRKRVRDNLTPTPKRSPTKKKREVETDPDVISRRQKQIDYGKNTIGYERYRQLVPKESRKKMHPRTPPLNLKFSRRAWDGLVKVWRQRLHFWDPPSEGGGNPECLEAHCEISDCSSTDGSLPSTPVQEWKRQKSSLPGWSPCISRKEATPQSNGSTTPHPIRRLTTSSRSTTDDCGKKLSGNINQEETPEQFLSQGCTPLPD
ncbi:hypothetical protein O3M35_006556 [Rhynocoris fuscipes]|uniref:Histone RNA hairpin-binding protein RNA-binding domain-containing protein n=1 Tax=Rhynocoris fuscipes TaxID=488301 RepID=A0AAW1DE56_9HEMI